MPNAAPSPTAAPPTLDGHVTRGLRFIHHGAVNGVTGSCHQLMLPDGQSVLVDCGLLQGAETSGDGRASAASLEINFPLTGVQALIVTHVHIDHVGRIPYLLAAGFRGPIVCTEASAQLLPMVIEDALKVGFTRDERLIKGVLAQLKRQVVPVAYKQWHPVISGVHGLQLRFQPAGHILGSAYVELDARMPPVAGGTQRVVFSGDLGAPFTPLLPAPQPPLRADVVVMESTYGDRQHEARKERRARLQALCEHAFGNRGTLLVPAFSIGRTQELLYELEEIIHRNRTRAAARGVPWGEVNVIVDSPLAADFTAGYARLKDFWDAEARSKVERGRHPLDFAQVTTIPDHRTHLKTVEYLARSGIPAIVIAASGMCSGGRIVNYLKAMLGDARHDVLFCGYQAMGTPGRDIQTYGPGPARPGKPGGYVMLDGQRFDIRAQVHTIGGFSAHADQKNLLDFVGRMKHKPAQVRLVHGDEEAKQTLAALLRQRVPGLDVVVPRG